MHDTCFAVRAYRAHLHNFIEIYINFGYILQIYTLQLAGDILPFSPEVNTHDGAIKGTSSSGIRLKADLIPSIAARLRARARARSRTKRRYENTRIKESCKFK